MNTLPPSIDTPVYDPIPSIHPCSRQSMSVPISLTRCVSMSAVIVSMVVPRMTVIVSRMRMIVRRMMARRNDGTVGIQLDGAWKGAWTLRWGEGPSGGDIALLVIRVLF